MFGLRKRFVSACYSLLYRIDPPFFRQLHPYADWVARDPDFEAWYEEGLKRSGTRPSLLRKDKYYNLFSALGLVAGLREGAVVECGAYRGHSSYLLCKILKAADPSFDGTGYHVFDSFEGLSTPIAEDKLGAHVKGMLSAGLDVVQATLKDFPGIRYHRGWIPEIFKTLEEARYRFVHVDVDLVEPTVGAIEYFYPRLVPGGILVCDDYASVKWPGTKGAVDVFCAKTGARKLALSTTQCIIFK